MVLVSLLVVLTQTADGGWRPGIGDPTFIGWFTVFAYLAAAVACFRAWQRVARASTRSRTLSHVWLLFAVLMLALGINKQLDLQSLFTVVGRQLALDHGWYEQRRAVQALFIRAVAVAGLLTLFAGAWLVRRHLADVWLAGLGAVFIVVFVVVRASSFHHVDTLLSGTLGGARVNWILELGGIALVFAGARRYARRSGTSGR